jgi:hypothetical protein
MTMRRICLAAPAVALTLAFAAAAFGDVKVTDHAYVRQDGGTDITIQSCSSDFTDTTADAPTPTPPNDEGGGERQANEPTVAVNPTNTSRMTAGSNDYCTVPTTTDAYAGFYYTTNGGASWTNSLLPGYPTDTSAEGSNCDISPQHCLVINSGDPVQAWDKWGHLFYGVLGFNRTQPANGSIFAARYDWPNSAATPDYRWTALVAQGTPSPLFAGLFNDKVQLEVDRGANSPYAGNASRPWGNVYVCWARFTGVSGNNGVFFSRSTDGGRTYSQPQKISDSIHGVQYCDIAVTSNGTVFVAWRQFEFNKGQLQRDGVAWTKSTDGGATFAKPAVAREFVHWDVRDGSSRDCGDGPSACDSGYVFFRVDSQVRITADPTDTAHPQAAYVAYNATVPGTQTPTGSTYETVEPGVGSQGQIYFIKTLNGGASWSAPTRITPNQAEGHQFFPDIDANAGKLHVVWQDSRNDTAQGPPSTPSGGDFRTMPIANRWVSNNPPGSVSVGTGIGVETFYAVSANRGASWTQQLVSSAAQMPQYEQFGNRDVPFFGDYNYISAVGNTALMAWTDERDPSETKPGTDPRYTNGDGTDGFDVHQCRVQSADGSWSADNCPNAGGLDQNIFGAILGP